MGRRLAGRRRIRRHQLLNEYRYDGNNNWIIPQECSSGDGYNEWKYGLEGLYGYTAARGSDWARDHFLAGAGFAAQQHRHPFSLNDLGERIENLSHGGTAADDFAEVMLFFWLRVQAFGFWPLRPGQWRGKLLILVKRGGAKGRVSRGVRHYRQGKLQILVKRGEAHEEYVLSHLQGFRAGSIEDP